ncbi:MAG: hypothetical protein P8J32_07520 [bacterium]|nr:hypothetical protein [bacterium]
MILEHFTDELIIGHAILWPAIISFIAGLFLFFFLPDYNILGRILGVVLFLVGLIGIVECTVSGLTIPDKELNPITKIETYPVEFRPENNTLYVFVNGFYTKVTRYTSEYVEAQDTMFRYYYESIGGNLKWGEDYYTVFKRNENAIFLDFLEFPVEIEMKGDTIRLEMTPDRDFIVKPDSLK